MSTLHLGSYSTFEVVIFKGVRTKGFAWVIFPVLWWCHPQFTAQQARNWASTARVVLAGV